MKANIFTGVIELTKTEAIAAGKLNSDKFNELKALREMFPTYRTEVVKTAKKGDHFKGLTTEYMEKYIKLNDDSDNSILTKFYTLRGRDSEGKKIEFAAIATYGELKMWFLETFPEIEQKADNVNAIIEKAREARMARKAEKAA